MARVRFVCLVCGRKLDDLSALILHFEREHRDLPDVKNWYTFAVNGFRYGRWRKYRDLRDGGLIRVVKE